VVGRVLAELGLSGQVPLVCVVTDPCYGFWRAWANPHVTRYLAAGEDARRQLIDYGVAPERIGVCGMPVHPRFTRADVSAARAAREALGLNADKFTVLLNAGCEGGGNLLRIFGELLASQLEAQAIFLAGRNAALRKAAETLASDAAFAARVIGYSDQVERLMGAAHVMVSKPGGLTTFEALHCGTPIVIDAVSPPMPQEAGTADLLVRSGAGLALRRAAEIVPVLGRMMTDAAHYSGMRAAAAALVCADSTQRIVSEIAALLPARFASRQPRPDIAAPVLHAFPQKPEVAESVQRQRIATSV
jgi:UDP-N-acetylglucosamine:LPS N-acetylglucosamine transferase